MVAKLALGIVAIIIIVAVAMAMAFWYFNQEAERDHEKDMRQIEQTDKIMETLDDKDDM